ncbi:MULTISPECIES: PTS lactose/cellobiose transporter subunit IIA [Halobacillus]|uniref:PTS lactose/cellobiose transporter subunit IIA n=1 Tax=Halobacillus naozhouensis TaxID=554880 RepID=A0ABY8IZN6_9BACI|nr:MULTISPECIES: PTS lactose/cellobiose transporter subunit IIA [Halobacillus]WFT73970.1 PTS lactose/cellobiose transporter subunit IIA [Halobacillus naozhouensis]
MENKTENKDITEISFQIILYAGNGKANAMEAIQQAKAGNFEEADRLIEEAGEELVKSHQYQTKLLQKEASGEENPINVLLVHSQDHLMTSMTVRDLAVEIIEIYKNK